MLRLYPFSNARCILIESQKLTNRSREAIIILLGINLFSVSEVEREENVSHYLRENCKHLNSRMKLING